MYVSDAVAQAAYFSQRYGFQPVGRHGSPTAGSDHFSIALQQGAIVIVLTQPCSPSHPGQTFLAAHGDGVADIALQVTPSSSVGEPVRTAAIRAFGNVRHTFVEGDAGSTGEAGVPGFEPFAPLATFASLAPLVASTATGLLSIDHFAVCLEAGSLEPTVAFYENVLGFSSIFEEKVTVGTESMASTVVQDDSRTVTLTLIEPAGGAAPGQIDHFLQQNGGAGVQHIAFSTGDAVAVVKELAGRGVEFLTTPRSYYAALPQRISPAAHSVEALEELNILVDADHDGQLFQIFTRSPYPRRTLFFEVIERRGARTFGSGNIKALYESVEAERQQQTGGLDL
ncbi:4-hydroxyphenylpyruvate dioxygenase [Streptomyces rectiverticillatus]|nr:4-hydroxyphenylpyruvate dioxygenase [Streptomyces rectiverticillatus]